MSASVTAPPPVVLIVVVPDTTSGAFCVTAAPAWVVVIVRSVAFVAARTTPLALASVTLTVPPVPPMLFRMLA